MPLAHSLARPASLPPHSGLLGLVAFLMTEGGWQGVGVGVSGSRLPSMEKSLSPTPRAPVCTQCTNTGTLLTNTQTHAHTQHVFIQAHVHSQAHAHTYTPMVD